jgi:hypothetical protein
LDVVNLRGNSKYHIKRTILLKYKGEDKSVKRYNKNVHTFNER